MKHPKYKDTWLKSFGTEICRLVTITETIFLKRKDEIPHDRKKDITYGTAWKRKIPIEHDSWEGTLLTTPMTGNSHRRPTNRQATAQQRNLHSKRHVYDH